MSVPIGELSNSFGANQPYSIAAMDVDSIVKILDSLKWPLTVVILVVFFVLAFRKEVAEVITRLFRIKYKGFEAEFNKNMKRIEKGIARVSRKIDLVRNLDPNEPEDFESTEEFFRSLLDISPRAAIITSWHLIQMAFLDAAIAKKIHIFDRKSVSLSVQELVHTMNLPEDLVAFYLEMKKIRDEVETSNDSMISRDVSVRYVRGATSLRNLFSSIAFDLKDLMKSK